jgi:uncharacterized phage protein (TIGR02218 family)
MHNLNTTLKNHLAQEVTTLAICWRITRRDGISQGFTTHDSNLRFENLTYLSAPGISSTAVSSQLNLAVDNLEIEGVLSHESILEEDIRAGLYDDAEITVLLVNYANVEAGTLTLKRGWFGEVTLKDQAFVVEVRGLHEVLQRTIGEVYTPTCRAILGDSRCKKDLAAFTHSGSITMIKNAGQFADASTLQAAGYFDYGLVTFTSGNNQGIRREIKRFAQGEFSLYLPLPYALTIGDNFIATAGCDKQFETCANKFSNALNFRGEPHVPGTDRLLETAATRRR